MTDHQFPLDEYCARIGVPCSAKPTVDRLEELQRAQVYTIPFENLDIQLGRGIDLTPSYVDNKVIREQRGGYCFELNGFFNRALTAASFATRPLLGRVHKNQNVPTGRTHQVSLVHISGRDWIVDVAFGGETMRVPMPLEHDATRDHDGTHYRLVDHELGHMLQIREDDQWTDLYSFDLCPVVPSDIDIANYYVSTSRPFFTSNRIAALCHPEGTTRLINYRCTTSRQANEQVEQLPDSPRYLQELRQRFGIVLDAPYDQLRPVQEDI